MGKVFSFISKSPEDLEAIASDILRHSGNKKIFLLKGEMGTGKTTLIKALCKILGVDDHVTSPTFSLVNEYRSKNGSTLFHFDFYRILSVSEVLDIGIEEYFSSGNYCFIEWPEKIPGLVPDDSVEIEIIPERNIRKISLAS